MKRAIISIITLSILSLYAPTAMAQSSLRGVSTQEQKLKSQQSEKIQQQTRQIKEGEKEIRKAERQLKNSEKRLVKSHDKLKTPKKSTLEAMSKQQDFWEITSIFTEMSKRHEKDPMRWLALYDQCKNNVSTVHIQSDAANRYMQLRQPSMADIINDIDSLSMVSETAKEDNTTLGVFFLGRMANAVVDTTSTYRPDSAEADKMLSYFWQQGCDHNDMFVGVYSYLQGDYETASDFLDGEVSHAFEYINSADNEEELAKRSLICREVAPIIPLYIDALRRTGQEEKAQSTLNNPAYKPLMKAGKL